MSIHTGYRMDRMGTIYLRYVDGSERPATRPEVLKVLTERPDITASLTTQD
ncbi:hypothetical protein [Magnetospira sp. QH-2]|uniref:hypothetical protein n=1 Tax=Magnetospira sp. (strain QH-2) TaxID=1288970 RepID=UPI0003E813AD|nr:hypothetical protein [Magnetospira sp. QH-2]CCQ73614.1 Protein of unknown function [Magnetospira sp. QH-2]